MEGKGEAVAASNLVLAVMASHGHQGSDYGEARRTGADCEYSICADDAAGFIALLSVLLPRLVLRPCTETSKSMNPRPKP